jgi:thiol-disulfide isomerase/thioredoxin
MLMRFFQTGFFAFFLLLFCTFPAGAQQYTASTIYPLPSQAIMDYIHAVEGRKVILIFESWCPYCRKVMPYFIKMEQKRPGSVIVISTQDDGVQLKDYLETLGPLPFPVLQASVTHDLYPYMNKIGITPGDGIPYIAVLDEEEKVLAQGSGLDMKRVAAYVLTGSTKFSNKKD